MLTILDFTGLRAGSQCRYAAAHDDALRPDLSDVCKLRAQRCLVEDLRRTLEQLGDDPASIRDRALILVGFAGAMRRSELAALDVSDVTFIDKGIEILIRRSKTDQLGVGHVLAIQYGSSIETCPVRALAAWMTLAGSTGGALFTAINCGRRITGRRLWGEAIASIVQRRAAAAGIEGDIARHSLHAEFATSCADAGVELTTWMQQTRHKSVAVAAGYVRRQSAWRNNAAARLDL